MPDGAADLHALARRLRDAGTEGQGLRKNLMKAIDDAAKPLAEKIGSLEHLKPYLPDRYAAVLAADLSVRASRSFSGDPRVQIVARARQHRRKVKLLDQGVINHPVYPRGPRREWNWANRQTRGMRPGFFSDPAKDALPDIRERAMRALTETARQITSGR